MGAICSLLKQTHFGVWRLLFALHEQPCPLWIARWLEFRFHSLCVLICFLSKFESPRDLLGGPDSDALKVKLVSKLFCPGNKLLFNFQVQEALTCFKGVLPSLDSC